MSDPLPLDLADALHASSDRRGGFGDRVHYYLEIGSTNDAAALFAERGAPEGTVVMASSQTAGRGRLGRSWYSPPGAGLYVSVVCRNTTALPYLTLAGGVAVAEGVTAAAGLPVEIKWPNDVVVRSGQAAPGSGRFPRVRKLAGVLAEGASTAGGLQYVILGFGINLRTAAYPPELSDRATSIEAELGREVEAGPILAETLTALAGHIEHLARGDRTELLARWRAFAPSVLGSSVEYDSPSGRIAGTSAGIADDGALLVRCGDRVQRVISGEVTWK
jgi:BirA family transcriptional regulator, biotin operon repressor / biotin---[acetyl-CoA-carboxylase] ligase